MRDVDMPDFLVAKLKEWKQDQRVQQRQLGERWEDGACIITTQSGRLPNPDILLRKSLIKLGAELPDLGRFTVHDFRHTYASMLFDQGADLEDVSELLGHSNIRITADTYTHLTKRRKKKTAHLVDELLVDT